MDDARECTTNPRPLASPDRSACRVYALSPRPVGPRCRCKRGTAVRVFSLPALTPVCALRMPGVSPSVDLGAGGGGGEGGGTTACVAAAGLVAAALPSGELVVAAVQEDGPNAPETPNPKRLPSVVLGLCPLRDSERVRPRMRSPTFFRLRLRGGASRALSPLTAT
eukprot:111424-Prorocentrum_minimum.AAC.4